MRYFFKHFFSVVIIVIILVQFYQPARNVTVDKTEKGFLKAYRVPKNIRSILKNSCFDCHSYNTVYPWYSNIQPARFIMEKHIQDGKLNLNFDDWGSYSERKRQNKIKGIMECVKKNEMPLSSYTLIHRNAVLSEVEKKMLISFLETISI